MSWETGVSDLVHTTSIARNQDGDTQHVDTNKQGSEKAQARFVEYDLEGTNHARACFGAQQTPCADLNAQL